MFDFEVTPSMGEIRRRMEDAGRSIDQGRQDMARQLAPVLRSLILEDYEVKAAGGRGRDGIKWTPLKAATVRAKEKHADFIGIETGQLEQSLTVRYGGQEADLVAEFTAPHADDFDRLRPLLPNDLPDEWLREIEAGMLEWAEQRVARTLKSLT